MGHSLHPAKVVDSGLNHCSNLRRAEGYESDLGQREESVHADEENDEDELPVVSPIMRRRISPFSPVGPLAFQDVNPAAAHL